MRTKQRTHIVFSLLLIAALQACNTLKYIPEDETLYTSYSIQVKGKLSTYDKGAIKEALSSVIQPAPNKKIMGIRLGLWARQRVDRGDAKFYAEWINKKIGEAPVYMTRVKLGSIEMLIDNRLNNLGYFYPEITSTKRPGKHTGAINFTVTPKKRLMITSYKYDAVGIPLLDSIINSFVEQRVIINPREAFNLYTLKESRSILANKLKDAGYYYFNPDYLLFIADTLASNKPNTAILNLRVKEKTPQSALAQYRISDLTVYPHYTLLSDSTGNELDTSTYKGVRFIQDDNFFYPEKMYPYLLIKEGGLYNKKEALYTSRRLNSLRTYRYVSIRFSKDSLFTDGLGTLKSNIYLAPLKKRSFRAEIEANSKSNNFVGSVFSLEYLNRNIFRGAESFSLKGKIGYEAQFSGGELSNLNTFETGLSAEYRVPRLVAPFNFQESFRYSLPKTKFRLSYELIRRVQYFSLNSFLALYGYQWDVNAYVTHSLNPISVNFINIRNRTPDFLALLDQNSYLLRSFQQQFIPGLSYNYQYNKLMLNDQRSKFLILFNADFAGNLFGLLQQTDNSTDRKTLFGVEYAQYAKLDVDVRNYFDLTQDTRLVSRLFFGYGLPYGNSESLPYSKQYFSGGPSSLRAFRIRSVGPGNFVSNATNASDSFFDQTGDIKIEANLEYRFPIYDYFKGAVFADAGNVWIKNGDEQNSFRGEFSDSWYQEMALGAGVGIRLDVEFIVIRLDVATPIRKPTNTSDFSWQNSFDLGNNNWRANNIIWNFAIGYPF
jgi:outer membrane protein insertion porin family